MEIKVIRKTKTPLSTIGGLSINGAFTCFTLEDCDRGLSSEFPLDEIVRKKVFGKTAIPTGRYEIAITFSNHFQKMLPILLNVPGYQGVRVHSVNRPDQTEGCILVGVHKEVDMITESRIAFNDLMDKITEVVAMEKIFITIESEKGIAL